MNIEIKFHNPAQREFYYSTNRNQCFSGGFNNGKTFIGCLKTLTLVSTFSNYRSMIGRQTFSDLKKTTMQTFFKNCPGELIETHNSQDGFTVFKNKSMIHWMHLDGVDDNSLRGLELNSILVDQAEEMEEKVYDVLDARLGRWDGCVVPPELYHNFPSGEWPIDLKGKPIVPSYHMLLTNPDTQFHFIYRKFHPDSLERRPDYFYTEGEWDASLGSKESYEEALKRDPEWVAKFIRGQWGVSGAQIHRLWPESLLDPQDELLDKIRRKGNLFRILDHGESSPTCCLWCAILNGVHIFYREYYVPEKVISYHRKAISELSFDEVYSGNYADPQIFKKTGQKDGGFWSTSDEYMDKSLSSPALTWIPADNNEFATRNRINELLSPSGKFQHPITGATPAPGIYFIKRSTAYPYGCFHSINQTQSARRKLIGYFEGKAVYSDDREESITDHAYDCVRYKIAMHGGNRNEPKRKANPNTFEYYRMVKRLKSQMILQAGSV